MPLINLEIQAQYRNLHIPIRNGSPKITLQLVIAGEPVREFSAELAEHEMVDWWAFYDIQEFQGQSLILRTLDEIPPEQAAWLAQAISQSDGILNSSDLYHEKYRPQFHFTSKRGWNNDPNGLVYVQGEWHMFYQHNPFGVKWGNMHWGHAVSRDLVHWTELPEALFQKSLADMAFSGGGLLDVNNSAGWKVGAEDPLVVAFTSTSRGECLAYSLDRGRTLHEAPQNPIIAHRGRDPKIIWYEPGDHWVLILYEEPEETGVGSGGGGTVSSFGYAIYTSTDLTHWDRQSFLPNWYECPELFEIAVDGLPGVKKWVIYGCYKGSFSSAYMVGSFNGKTFKPEMTPALAHHGPAFYAAQIFNHAPAHRRVMVGWLTHANYPGMPFSQGMTVPLELSLRATLYHTGSPYRLCFYPVNELAGISTRQVGGENLDAAQANAFLARSNLGELMDVQLELSASQPVSFYVGDESILWVPERGEVSFAGKTASLETGLNRLALRLLVDRSVTEIFADGGSAAFAAMTIFPASGRRLRLDGAAQEISLHIHTLKSTWD